MENEWLAVILRAVYRRHTKPAEAQEAIERAYGVKLQAAFEEGHREGRRAGTVGIQEQAEG
jgi:flagellar biosynthesis/type III secretory pathway protein FliH